MLGKLAKYLRLLGLDAPYLHGPLEIKRIRESDGPAILITRRTRPTGYSQTVVVHSELVRQQLSELKHVLKPWIDQSKIMNRCVECNVALLDIDRNGVEHLVPEFVFHKYNRFKKCPSCGKIYWEGSHAQHMSALLREIVDQL